MMALCVFTVAIRLDWLGAVVEAGKKKLPHSLARSTGVAQTNKPMAILSGADGARVLLFDQFSNRHLNSLAVVGQDRGFPVVD
jgi:hypothetical protein